MKGWLAFMVAALALHAAPAAQDAAATLERIEAADVNASRPFGPADAERLRRDGRERLRTDNATWPDRFGAQVRTVCLSPGVFVLTIQRYTRSLAGFAGIGHDYEGVINRVICCLTSYR